eukprot:GHVO01010176.1.p1 GENE.GHVO01010176.1~~GHVO01010176.1.p1  ORF type:complete len:711 (+),score=94.30 GHVO01010176.1:95-2227(+)
MGQIFECSDVLTIIRSFLTAESKREFVVLNKTTLLATNKMIRTLQLPCKHGRHYRGKGRENEIEVQLASDEEEDASVDTKSHALNPIAPIHTIVVDISDPVSDLATGQLYYILQNPRVSQCLRKLQVEFTSRSAKGVSHPHIHQSLCPMPRSSETLNALLMILNAKLRTCPITICAQDLAIDSRSIELLLSTLPIGNNVLPFTNLHHPRSKLKNLDCFNEPPHHIDRFEVADDGPLTSPAVGSLQLKRVHIEDGCAPMVAQLVKVISILDIQLCTASTGIWLALFGTSDTIDNDGNEEGRQNRLMRRIERRRRRSASVGTLDFQSFPISRVSPSNVSIVSCLRVLKIVLDDAFVSWPDALHSVCLYNHLDTLSMEYRNPPHYVQYRGLTDFAFLFDARGFKKLKYLKLEGFGTSQYFWDSLADRVDDIDIESNETLETLRLPRCPIHPSLLYLLSRRFPNINTLECTRHDVQHGGPLFDVSMLPDHPSGRCLIQSFKNWKQSLRHLRLMDAFKDSRRVYGSSATDIALSTLADLLTLSITPCCALSLSSAAFTRLIKHTIRLQHLHLLSRHLSIDVMMLPSTLEEVMVTLPSPRESRSRVVVEYMDIVKQRTPTFPRLKVLEAPLHISNCPPDIVPDCSLIASWIGCRFPNLISLKMYLSYSVESGVTCCSDSWRWEESLKGVPLKLRGLAPRLSVCVVSSGQKTEDGRA